MRLSGKNSEGEVATTRRGFRLVTSIGGPLTGRGGNLVVIDDPLKAQDALSQPKREAANNWFANTHPCMADGHCCGLTEPVIGSFLTLLRFP